MKKLLLLIMLCLALCACTKTVNEDPIKEPDITETDDGQENGNGNKDHDVFNDPAIDQLREDMGQSALGIIYAGTAYGEDTIKDKLSQITGKYPFISKMSDKQIVYGDMDYEKMIIFLILIPRENTSIAIDSLNDGKVLYRDEYGTPILFISSMDTGDPTFVINVVDDRDNTFDTKPALSLYDGHLRENMNMLLLDLSDYDWLVDNVEVPFYQQSCFNNIMNREKIMNELDSGKNINALWETEINGHWYLVFGVGDDPTNSDGIDTFYACRPDMYDVYYSDDMTSWKALE